jgi:thiosulfate/3-mercaptopyruvate sulfurtransferase
MDGRPPFTTLVETAQLAAILGDPAAVIVDCRFDLKDTAAGEAAYRDAHVPGAVYAHLDRDLAGTKTGLNGRHPLPDVNTAARTFGRWGITHGVQVVAYDQDTGGWASRLWWMLRWLGHHEVAVLDGGFARWTAEGHPVTSIGASPPPRVFIPHPQPHMVVTSDDLASPSGRAWHLLDARAPERFRGDVEPIDRTPGHIPGAVNVPFVGNLDGSGRFHSPGELAARFRAALGDHPPDRAVCYCGSGVTACQNVLALEHAGLHGARLYVGSWSEWSSDPARPVEKGEGSA